MSAHRLRLATQGAITVGLLAIGACDDPVARTDLRPDGPPEVLSVLVQNDADAGLIEKATFCKVGDDKRPSIVGLPDFTTQQVCDDDLSKPATEVTDAVPTNWYVRVMFDELLNPDVEELVPVIDMDTMMPNGTFTGTIKNTKPVTLTCGGNPVEYDGYYSPSGNNVTWPLGPSLFIQPVDLSTVATSSECEVKINDNVTDKTGNKVPDAEKAAGYKWKIAELALAASSPPVKAAGKEVTQGPDAPLTLTFNAFIDATKLTAAQITVKEGPVNAMGKADCAAATTVKAVKTISPTDGDPTSVDITLDVGAAKDCPGAMAGDPNVACLFNPSKTYVITLSGDAQDVAGGRAALPGAGDFTLCFATSAP